MSFMGKRQAGQFVHVYPVIFFAIANDTVWFNGRDNMVFEEGDNVPVRYQKHRPSDARINLFTAIWGDTIVYGGIPLVILLIVFIHPAIIPYRAKIQLSSRKPFFKLV